mmetsp:Transcript_27821/g.70288  ORF Transcript_27821/g.70288 Transcript_27821/m.70288 type:complete len:89 (+) Transcript_27821:393-659(+)|eukprot:CAMPEP_0178993762 /NCGR_PEP_ID=MMETSP0795-20121207/6887_1 /TAXON_ID=88552 /ORGANISM="Amoebophrya sp., Strain Ameob2" /LENGTH=88 /DNA_ID=CAMNT_0020685865 /DNA_START=344 /DNA_END=610 /DNA_ORIENTATION=-
MGAVCPCCSPRSDAPVGAGKGAGKGSGYGAAGNGDAGNGDDAWMGAKTGGEQWETVQQWGQKESYSGGEDEIETTNWTVGETYGTQQP